MNQQIEEIATHDKRAETFIALIMSYTDQIEDYEKRNYNECMTCLGFIAALLAAIGAILLVHPSLETVDKPIIYLAIAFILMLIPAVITIFVYNFSMNCRRSAILRGYLQFLEDRLNAILCEKSMLYHSILFTEEIVFFPVNRYGPLALVVALIGIFYTCARWSISIFRENLPALNDYIITYGIYYGLVLIICIPCCILYGAGLSRNNAAIKRSREICKQLYDDSINKYGETQILYGLEAQIEMRIPKKKTKAIKKSLSKI